MPQLTGYTGRMTQADPLSPSPRVAGEYRMRWFSYGHLPPRLQLIGREFYSLAAHLCETLEPGEERGAALLKLLECRDWAYRAAL